MNEYPVGDTILLNESFTVNGTPTDPTAVTLLVTDPSGAQTTYTYAATTITKLSTGNYQKQLVPGVLGEWRYTWTGTGTAPGVSEGVFVITDNMFANVAITPVRSTMTRLIRFVRTTTNDLPGSAQIFSDDQVQDWLDDTRQVWRYEILVPERTFLSGGSVQYLNFDSRRRYWEDDVVLVNNIYGTVTPATSDTLRGRWYFASDQATAMPIMTVGQTYDPYRASGDLLMAWADRVTLDFDFQVGSDAYTRSQKIANLRAQAELCYARAQPQTFKLTRNDQIEPYPYGNRHIYHRARHGIPWPGQT